jgi:hypothetical protein
MIFLITHRRDIFYLATIFVDRTIKVLDRECHHLD